MRCDEVAQLLQVPNFVYLTGTADKAILEQGKGTLGGTLKPSQELQPALAASSLTTTS